MGKVHRLDDNTINKIAAGEIVERPASVVKELVENSIDAGASIIEIEIKNGGRQLIKVTDNGCGMEHEDAILAIERHATSKIYASDDLLNLRSLGFRGEALPSIASVSNFSLLTKTKAADCGTLIEIKGGIVKKVKQTGSPDGTTITVQDLFFNTPARLKYLKSIPTEAGNISEIVARIALGYPEISFRLQHQEYEMLFTSGNNNIYDTITAIFGKDFAKEMVAIKYEADGLKIHGYYGKPAIARTNRKYEIFYVNRRFVYSRLLSSAVEKAYHTLLPIARYPFVILFLEIDPGLVDVNVHPAKFEVKFVDESSIYKAVYHTIHSSLKENSLLANWISPEDSYQQLQNSNDVVKTQSGSGSPIANNPFSGSNSSLSNTAVQRPVYSRDNLNIKYDSFEHTKEEVASVQEAARSAIYDKETSDLGTVKGLDLYNIYIFPKTIKNTYILVQDGKGLLFIDQHAAHERIIYERLFQYSNETLGTQSLLIPETVTLSYAQFKAIVERLKLFNDLGFELETFGGNTLIIRGIPVVLIDMDYKQIVLDLIEEYLNFKIFKSPAEIKESFIITMACRTAIKAGDKISPIEIEGLIKDLFKCDNPYTCPHGRPTIFRMNYEELEKKFLRR